MMRHFLCVAILSAILGCAQSASIENKGSGLIVNGQEAPRGKYPWQIVLYQKIFTFKFFICGGSIINENYILTAAHCFGTDLNPRKYDVAVGKHEMDRDDRWTENFKVEEIIINENYDNNNPFNAGDIAIIKLKSSIAFNDRVQPVNLAIKDQEPFGRDCWASGFGTVNLDTGDSADALQELKTKTLSVRKCQRLVRRVDPTADYITEEDICTRDRRSGVCSGDSGGPLGCFDGNGTYTQFGVLSWGLTKCDDGFAVWTRVSEYRLWISRNIM